MKKILIFTVMAALLVLLSDSVSGAHPSSETIRLFDEGEYFYNAQAYSYALDRFSKAAGRGHARAQFYLGLMYASGLGVTKDEARAIEYWKMAARQGNVLAQRNLANFGVTDWSRAPDVVQVPLPQMSAIQAARPSDDAQRFFSEGVNFYNARNFSSALDRFTKAAELGHVEALFHLAVMHEQGEGVPENFSHALGLYRRAAELGYAVAQYDLAVMYTLGDRVAQDDSRAVYWYRRAADQGFPLALNNLGAMYEAGRGVPMNEARAIEFYKMAARQGEENARTNLARLGIDHYNDLQ